MFVPTYMGYPKSRDLIVEYVVDKINNLESPPSPPPLDDFPLAVDDTIVVSAGTEVNGNVTDNDIFGDDGIGDPKLTQLGNFNGTVTFDAGFGSVAAINGLYGTLVMYSTGFYTYMASPSASSSLVDRFSYTIQDGNGSTSRATITVLIQ